MKSILLAGIILLLAPSPCLCAGDPGFMWLEQLSRGHSMSSSVNKGGEKNNKKMDMTAMMKKAAEQNKDKKTTKKKRPAMSRPANFLLKAGTFRDDKKNLMPSYLANTSCYIQVPDSSIHELQPSKKRSGYKLYDEALAGGFYQMFAYNDFGVKDGIRYQLFSQYRFRNYGSDKTVGSIKDEKDDTIRSGFFNNRPRFRLIDVKGDYSDDRYADRKYTGEELVLQVMLDEKAVAGAAVTVTSSRGWERTSRTDKNGNVTFVLIKELFHDKGIDKAPAPYLVKAEYTRQETGTVNEETYDRETFRVTRHFSVRPTPLEWKSKQLGFLVFTGSWIAVMFAAGIRRRRRNWYESR